MGDFCCCEYLDAEGERNHILACCCNCPDLDEGFESLITGQAMTARNKRGLAMTLNDRLRIPWMGGARQIKPDMAIPVVALPSLLLLATISLPFTIASAFLVVALLIIVYTKYHASIPQFFFAWAVTSIIALYTIYQVLVVSFLMILLEENLLLTAFMMATIGFIYATKRVVVKSRCSILDGGKEQYCTLCQIPLPSEGSQHRYWIDACVIPENHTYYIGGLIFALITLLYSSNLTLTTVCHPFNVIYQILLPDDCSDAYQQIELSLSFVTALYSLLLALFILWELLCSLKSTQRIFSKGLFCNRMRHICCYINQFKFINN